MTTLDISDDTRDRIERLREELATAHAGPYASVDTADALAYLLDLAEAVDDPDRLADPEQRSLASSSTDDSPDPADPSLPFDREAVREQLEARNRRHSDPDAADEMDLYDIAAAFDVTGRSDMTKSALVEAILSAATALATDPFTRIDVDLHPAQTDPSGTTDQTDDSDDTHDADATTDATDSAASSETDSSETDDDGGASQLNAMMSLLDTHDDKWDDGDGDARYEVELPNGTVETARTKDDVRALLFRHY